MRLKLLRRRWSVAAPRMTVRTARPWWAKAALWFVVLGSAGALAAWTYDLGARFAGFDRSAAQSDAKRLETTVADLRKERDTLLSAVNAASSDLSVERAAQDKLIDQVKALEAENAKLKQDLAFFERILPPSSAQGISIRSFQVEREDAADGARLRYRVLVSQAAKATRDFVGQVQFVLVAVQDGRTETIEIPARQEADDRAFALSFRMFQRLEGVLEIPTGVQVRSVQLRVLENGAIRAQQTAAIG